MWSSRRGLFLTSTKPKGPASPDRSSEQPSTSKHDAKSFAFSGSLENFHPKAPRRNAIEEEAEPARDRGEMAGKSTWNRQGLVD